MNHSDGMNRWRRGENTTAGGSIDRNRGLGVPSSDWRGTTNG